MIQVGTPSRWRGTERGLTYNWARLVDIFVTMTKCVVVLFDILKICHKRVVHLQVTRCALWRPCFRSPWSTRLFCLLWLGRWWRRRTRRRRGCQTPRPRDTWAGGTHRRLVIGQQSQTDGPFHRRHLDSSQKEKRRCEQQQQRLWSRVHDVHNDLQPEPQNGINIVYTCAFPAVMRLNVSPEKGQKKWHNIVVPVTLTGRSVPSPARSDPGLPDAAASTEWWASGHRGGCVHPPTWAQSHPSATGKVKARNTRHPHVSIMNNGFDPPRFPSGQGQYTSRLHEADR